jgi:drug/metabolite transporter (DMT)-like permease
MYLFLALSSGVLWGVWGFGYGRYGRVMSRYSVLLFSASGAALTFLVAGLVRHDIRIDSIDVRDGLLGGFLNLLGSVLLLKALTMGKIGVASGVNAAYVLIPIGYSLTIGETIRDLKDVEALMDPKLTTDEVMSHFVLDGYDPHPAINFKVAV